MNNKIDRIYNVANLLNFNIKFKDESLLMKCCKYLLFFNRDFMDKFATIIGNDIYFPNKKSLESDPELSVIVLCHERVHQLDKKDNKLFSLLYLFPQVLAPFMLLFLFYSWIWAVSLFVLFLLPLPAFWRMVYELKAYKISMFAKNELFKELNFDENKRTIELNLSADFYNKQFTTIDYYFMWPFGVKKQLSDTVKKIISDDILAEDKVYSEIRDVLSKTKTS